MTRASIGWVVTVPGAVRAFVRPYLEALADGHDVTLYVNGTREELGPDFPSIIEVVPVDIRRPIAPLADARALMSLVGHFRRRRHIVVQSLLPKAGLLGMMAARIAGIPHRIHMFTGQVWATRTGPMRRLLKSLDTLTANAATLVMADSRSQRDFLRNEGVARHVHVIGPGSVAGMDSQRFWPDPEASARVKSKHGIPKHHSLVGFLGRLNHDKGVPLLIQAFASIDAPDWHLMLYGPDEEGIEEGVEVVEDSAARIHFAGATSRPEAVLPAFDLFCLPSFREGFGVSVLEASACQVPVVASRIYGLTDAVVEGETGWLFPPGDVAALAQTLEVAIADADERHRRGSAGRERVVRDFATETFVKELLHIYEERIGPLSAS